jgi:hypothetical protein
MAAETAEIRIGEDILGGLYHYLDSEKSIFENESLTPQAKGDQLK